MSQITRLLCQKYTDLSEEEITYLEEYGGSLQALANAEQADVFIDCRSLTGKSAIVVGEAKPQTTESSYSKSLLGMPMHWKDEPAMERSFRLGIPTIGRKAVCVPEDSRVVQTVEPIFYKGRLLAVLIYEKKTALYEAGLNLSLEKGAPSFPPGSSQWLVQAMEEAVILVDMQDCVCACNDAARGLYRKLGYVGDLLGMPATNILLDNEPEGMDGEWREVTTGDCQLRYRQIRLDRNEVRYALLLQDITPLWRMERDYELLSVALRELRHRMKNNIQLLASLLQRQGKGTDSSQVRSVLRDTVGRLLALNATLEETPSSAGSCYSLRGVLQRVRENILRYSLDPEQNITIHVEGEDLSASAEIASPISLVVNELAQNAVKHAFPHRRAGNIYLELEKTPLFSRISVRDDGVGMDTERTCRDTIGLSLVRTIVREKLSGELTISSDKGGTAVSFDFII